MVNAGDTAWILISTAMVMLMTPGVALFYGGMVRKKSVISTLMMNFAMLGVVGLLWVFYAYSLSFGPDSGGIIGSLKYIFLNNVGGEPSSTYATTVPHLAFMMFQGMFAIITVALITGAVVERIKFSALMIFAVAWLTLIFAPVAHWVWGAGGWMAKLGVLDFAGGIVVHVNAGLSALALVIVLGARRGFRHEPMEPSSIPLVMLGAGLLWFGWFGFNAGSALGSNSLAASALVATNSAGAAAATTWMLLAWNQRRPTLLGIATGAVAGLAAVTPGAGFIPPIYGVMVGIVAAVVCYYAMIAKIKMGVDDSLDVMAVHGVGGILGVLAVGLFASAAVNPAGANGLIFGGGLTLLGKQALGVLSVGAFAFGGTWVIAKVIDAIFGLRVKEMEEAVGLDLSQHGERAFGGIR
ncbi:ammonium transporter [Dehalogenimonas etheniformans]|uniref:Ammonium transporter n=1 Tax=Dehalogenimonas etheniformans TaxID=1536648 RepID=A0A2P5P935_9CHLR|nr:ammonium transporter [Dehalogenimonas etheniformans]PPD58807.1 ammonium transporter [Dehalogenimonas etheniformans]QNT76424.1 ammonium transporter [Dehalogenimonas etheniformans]